VGIDATIATEHKSTESVTIHRTSQTTNGKEMVTSIRSEIKFQVSVFQKTHNIQPQKNIQLVIEKIDLQENTLFLLSF
jgi:hypothetical protein